MNPHFENLATISPYSKNPLIKLLKHFLENYNEDISSEDRLQLLNICSQAYLDTLPILNSDLTLECLAHKTITYGTTKLTLSDKSKITLEQNGQPIEILTTVPFISKISLHPQTLWTTLTKKN